MNQSFFFFFKCYLWLLAWAKIPHPALWPVHRKTWNQNIWFFIYYLALLDLTYYGGSDGKASAYNAGDTGSIPGSGRSPGEGNGNPLQYSYKEVPWTEEPGGLQSMGSQRVGHNLATSLSVFHIVWEIRLVSLNLFIHLIPGPHLDNLIQMFISWWCLV